MSSPSLSLDGLIGSLLIDVHEKRDVATCDVPGAFLHPDLPPGKRLFLCLRDQMVDIMCRLNPDYKNMSDITKVRRYYMLKLFDLFMDVLKRLYYGMSYIKRPWKEKVLS